MSGPRLDDAWRERLLEILAPADSPEWSHARSALWLRTRLDAIEKTFAALFIAGLFASCMAWGGFALAQAAGQLNLASKASLAGSQDGAPMFFGLMDFCLGLCGLAVSLGMLREFWPGPSRRKLGLPLLAACGLACAVGGCWMGMDSPWGLVKTSIFGFGLFLALAMLANLLHACFIAPLQNACAAWLWIVREQWSDKMNPLCRAKISAPENVELPALLREALKTKPPDRPARPWARRPLVWVDALLGSTKPVDAAEQFSRLDLAQLERLAQAWGLQNLEAEKERQALLLASAPAPDRSSKTSRL